MRLAWCGVTLTGMKWRAARRGGRFVPTSTLIVFEATPSLIVDPTLLSRVLSDFASTAGLLSSKLAMLLSS